MNSSKGFSLDLLGVGLSGVCLIHCILLPLLPALVASQSMWFWENENVHLGLLIAILPIATIALGIGYARHRKKSVLILGGAGVFLLVAGWISEAAMGTLAEKIATICGGILLAMAHLTNNRKQCALANEQG